ncbi:ATP-binding protein [Kineococcus glutinatus]|uniref:Histidine kinase/HSP90-like ATPase domain-containing protein n=1 Tax=Kineococcus glutinatus TaxID=1070872 RepID=A0ABP8VHC5_9ACTN
MPLGSPLLPASHWAAFAHDARSVPRARHLLRDVLDSAGVDETTRAEIEVVLSEIVGNAVRHARPLPGDRIEVACRLLPGGAYDERHVEISVRDGGGPTRPAPRTAGETETTGRGLRIVDGLADEWGVVEELDDLSRTVWATFGGPRQGMPR